MGVLQKERKLYKVYPHSKEVFRAFKLTPYHNVKVVIVGQDPYPHKYANGLAFSAKESIEDIPSTLYNIFEELNEDIGYMIYRDPNLDSWTKQGVFLINRILTVRSERPLSHKNIGWETFTEKVLLSLWNRPQPTVFILWGNYAQNILKSLSSISELHPHKLIVSPHPSRLSAHRGFFGSKPFSTANKFLIKNNISPINWNNHVQKSSN